MRKRILSKKNISIGGIVLLFALLLSFTQSTSFQATAAQIKQNKIYNISNTPRGTSAYPEVLQEGFIRTHIAWIEYRGEDASTLMYTTFQSGKMGTPIEITRETGRDRNPVMAMARLGGRLHFIFVASNKRMEHIAVSISGGKAKIEEKNYLSPEKVTVPDPTDLDPTDGISMIDMEVKAGYPALIVDRSGTLHAIWTDNREDPVMSTYHIVHKMYKNGAWESGDRKITSSGDVQGRPSLAVTSDGIVHLAFNILGREMTYAMFDGSKWTRAAAPVKGKFNLVSLGAKGTTLHALWSNSQKGHTILYSKKTDTTGWSAPVQVDTDIGFDDFPYIIVDPRIDKIYATWSSGTGTSALAPVAREIKIDGTLAKSKKVVENGKSNWVRGVRSGPSTYIVWQDKASGDWEIYLTDLFSTEPPPSPPCATYDPNTGKCLQVDTAIGVLCTRPNCIADILFVIILSFSGGVGVLLIMYAGYLFITSRDRKEQVQKGREIIVAVIVGLLFIIFSIVVMTTITVDILGLPNFTP